MKISMERAWERAVTLLRGNKDVLAVLAGLFFFLPSFVELFFGGEPTVTEGMTLQQALPAFENYAISILPYLIVVTIVGAAGRLAMLVLFTDRSRPTVLEALKRGAIAVVPYMLVMLIVWLALSVAAAVLVGAPAKAGITPVAAIAFALLAVLTVYVLVKLSLVPAVIVAERTANPLTVIARSWRLTRDNGLRLFLFYALLFVPYFIIAALAEGLFGAMGTAIGGDQGQLFVGGAASSVVAALWGALNAAIIAALYEQLSGRSGRSLAEGHPRA